MSKRVEAYLADGATVVMIVRPDGRLVEDWRPMTTAYLLCTVEENGRMERDSYNVAALERWIGVLTEERQNRLVHEATKRALFQLKASPPPAGEMPVILASGPSAILPR